MLTTARDCNIGPASGPEVDAGIGSSAAARQGPTAKPFEVEFVSISRREHVELKRQPLQSLHGPCAAGASIPLAKQFPAHPAHHRPAMPGSCDSSRRRAASRAISRMGVHQRTGAIQNLDPDVRTLLEALRANSWWKRIISVRRARYD